MTLATVFMFLMQLKNRAQEQIDNSLFGELLGEHGLFVVLPVLQFCYLMFRSVENVSLQRCFYLAMALIAFIYLLNCNHFLVDRNKSEVIISRSEEPERFQHILDECVNRSSDREPSTKVYIFLWKTDLWISRVGHMAAMFFDAKMTWMSRWPTRAVMFTDPTSLKRPVPAGFTDSIEYDIHLEDDNRPDQVIVIPEGVLAQNNIDMVVEWYESVAKGPTGIYKGKFKNCADLVRQALKAGGFYLANPSLRWLKLGLSVPNDIADRIVYTISLKQSSKWIKLSHDILTVSVWMICMHLLIVIFYIAKPFIPGWTVSFLFQFVLYFLYHLFRTLD